MDDSMVNPVIRLWYCSEVMAFSSLLDLGH